MSTTHLARSGSQHLVLVGMTSCLESCVTGSFIVFFGSQAAVRDTALLCPPSSVCTCVVPKYVARASHLSGLRLRQAARDEPKTSRLELVGRGDASRL